MCLYKHTFGTRWLKTSGRVQFPFTITFPLYSYMSYSKFVLTYFNVGNIYSLITNQIEGVNSSKTVQRYKDVIK